MVFTKSIYRIGACYITGLLLGLPIFIAKNYDHLSHDLPCINLFRSNCAIEPFVVNTISLKMIRK